MPKLTGWYFDSVASGYVESFQEPGPVEGSEAAAG